MDRSELQRLQMLYREMDDLGFATALHHGPEAYIEPAVWTVITEEASRRGIAVPNKEEREAYWEVVRAEETALESPPLPWWWHWYFYLLFVALMLAGIHLCKEIVGILQAPPNPERWQAEDLKFDLQFLAWLFIALLALCLQYAHVRSRLSAKVDGENLPPRS
jgi:hypothetical protein